MSTANIPMNNLDAYRMNTMPAANNNNINTLAAHNPTNPLGGNDKYYRRWEWAHHRWNPFPPYTHPAIKAITAMVILFLIAVFITYVVFVSIAYAKDKDSPKQALKFKNKSLKPLEYPAITICNLDATRMSLSECTIYQYDLETEGTATNQSCFDSIVESNFGEGDVTLPCWTVNLKSDKLPVPYKAHYTGLFNSMWISFDTDVSVEAISVSLHEAHVPTNLDSILTPHTFTANGEQAILSLQKVETSNISNHKMVTWECDTSHLVLPTIVTNHTDIILYYKDLRVISRKEEYSYKAVNFIGDIAAAFEILLGLSFFKVYLLMLAAYILLGNRTYFDGKHHPDAYAHTHAHTHAHPQGVAAPPHVGAPVM